MKTVKILIIDDDADDVELFRDAVKEIDNKIVCMGATNGEEGFLMLKSGGLRPDYIFLDLNMPRLNGIQCLELIKNEPFLRAIPVIIYTTSKLAADIDKTREMGASYFISKPSRLQDLKHAISDILHGKLWNRAIRSPLK